MSVFIDCNILIISAQPSHPMHTRAVRSIEALIEQETSLVVTPQIAAEFWNVATRPADRNGLGMSHDEARQELARLVSFFTVVSESLDVYNEWNASSLVTK